MTNLHTLANTAKAWPFEQARALIKRLDNMEKQGTHKHGPIVFETGYGPSGPPHIGTFGEVVRTSMVRRAFEVLAGNRFKTRLICISDDMDGMRQIPPDLPNREKLMDCIQMPLTAVPDPFGTHDSYGTHMNARLCAFLDDFGFDYEFLSATRCYRDGTFDPMLRKALVHYKDIMTVMLPTLSPARQATYSPFLPISPATGRILYVPMKAVDPQEGTVTFEDETGDDVTVPVTGGHVKLQWKPDFGMRWAALGVDFEMFGKDHQDNAPLYSKIARILGAHPPQQYVYELFLDEQGEKISKTKGNGVSLEQWLTYAPPESLSLFQFQKPRVAKRLYSGIIPTIVDTYLDCLAAWQQEEPARQIENPVWHIHGGKPPKQASPVSFTLLLNLVNAANPRDKEQLWAFISRHVPGTSPQTHPLLDRLAGYAMAYCRDFIAPGKTCRTANAQERAAMRDLANRLRAWDGPADSGALQTLTFSVGKAHKFTQLRLWFKALYEVLLGQSAGPRFGSLIALYGIAETATLIEQALQKPPEDQILGQPET